MPNQVSDEVLRGYTRLSSESLSLEKCEVVVPVGMTEESNDIGKCTLSASLIANDCHKVGVQRD